MKKKTYSFKCKICGIKVSTPYNSIYEEGLCLLDRKKLGKKYPKDVKKGIFTAQKLKLLKKLKEGKLKLHLVIRKGLTCDDRRLISPKKKPKKRRKRRKKIY